MREHRFESYKPPNAIPTVLYMRDQEGRDWYELVSLIPDGTVVVTVNHQNRVSLVLKQETLSESGEKTLHGMFPFGTVLAFAPDELEALPSFGDYWDPDSQEFNSPSPMPRTVRKVDAIRRMRAAGALGAFQQTLAQLDKAHREDWEAMTVIVETDPTFVAAVTTAGFSATQIDEIFNGASGG